MCIPQTKIHRTKKWEVSIALFYEGEYKKYKVTRRLLDLFVAETKILNRKKEALQLFYEWLR